MRRVEIGGIANESTGAWMLQVVRNLLDAQEGFLTGTTKLIMDRDPIFTADGGAETACCSETRAAHHTAAMRALAMMRIAANKPR